MKTYNVDNNQYIHIKNAERQNLFETLTRDKEITLNCRGYEENNLNIYPFYLNDNAYLKIEFKYLNKEEDSDSMNYNININFKYRSIEKEYYQNNIQLDKEFDIKIFQEKETIALYINNEFLTIIKDERFTYGNIFIENPENFSFKIKEIKSASLDNSQWIVHPTVNNSFLLLNEKSNYVIENISNENQEIFIDNNETFFEPIIIYQTIKNIKKDKDYYFSSNTFNNLRITTDNTYLDKNRDLYKNNLIENYKNKEIVNYGDSIINRVKNINIKSKWGEVLFHEAKGNSVSNVIFGIINTGKNNSENLIKENIIYTFSIKIINNNDKSLFISNNLSQKIEIKPKETKRVIMKQSGNGKQIIQFNFSTLEINDSFNFLYSEPIILEGDYDLEDKEINDRNLVYNLKSYDVYNSIPIYDVEKDCWNLTINSNKASENQTYIAIGRKDNQIVKGKEYTIEGYIEIDGKVVEDDFFDDNRPNTFHDNGIMELKNGFFKGSFLANTDSDWIFHLKINNKNITEVNHIMTIYNFQVKEGKNLIGYSPAPEEHFEINKNQKMMFNKNEIILEITPKNYLLETTELPKIQLEENSFITPYIENDNLIIEKDESILKVPTKNNIIRSSGTLIYDFNPTDIKKDTFNLFQIGDFNLVYKNKKFILYSKTDTIPNNQLYISYEKLDKNIKLIWTWINNNHKLILLSNNLSYNAINETEGMNGVFDNMDFSKEPLNPHILNDIKIYSLDFYYNKENLEELNIFQKNNSQSVIFGLNFKEKVDFYKKPFLESSLAPMDGSPILVRNNDGPLQRQFFFDDETGKYRDYNEEYIEYDGTKELRLSYNNLDETFKPIVEVTDGILKGDFFTGDIKINNNVLELEISNEASQQLLTHLLKVTYRIKNSFNIEFNETAANDSYIINLDNPNGDDIIVTQEGDRFNNRKLATEIELNPILNPRHEGFMYITKNSQTTNSFRIQISSNMVVANGMDSCDIMIEAIDEYGNEVLSPYLNVYIINDEGKETSQYGTVYPLINYETMKARNTSGRLYFKYDAPYISSKDLNKEKKIYVVVYDRKNNIGTQATIVLKPSFDENKTTLINIPKYSQLPFEYFSRYFERKNIPEAILEVLDFDKNEQITREDLISLESLQYNEIEMGTISKNIKDWERF